MDLSYDRAGSGPPLVLVHGIMSHWQMWRPVLGRLAPERDVIAVDLPGFGRSPVLPAGETPTVEALAAAVATFVKERLGIDRFHVAGNSLGGGVALALARSGVARSATALSPIGFWDDRELAYSRISLRGTRLLTRAVLPVVPRLARMRAARASLLFQVAAHGSRWPAGAVEEAIRDAATCPGFEATLDAAITSRDPGTDPGVPITIAWGTRDRLLLPRQADRARALLPAARHVPLPGSGHVPTWDDPELVAQILLEGSARG